MDFTYGDISYLKCQACQAKNHCRQCAAEAEAALLGSGAVDAVRLDFQLRTAALSAPTRRRPWTPWLYVYLFSRRPQPSRASRSATVREGWRARFTPQPTTRAVSRTCWSTSRGGDEQFPLPPPQPLRQGRALPQEVQGQGGRVHHRGHPHGDHRHPQGLPGEGHAGVAHAAARDDARVGHLHRRAQALHAPGGPGRRRRSPPPAPPAPPAPGPTRRPPCPWCPAPRRRPPPPA